MRWTRNDTEAYKTVSDMGEKLRNAYSQYQAGQAYKEGAGLGAASADDYDKYATQFADTNPEAAQIYRDAAEKARAGVAEYTAPTAEQRQMQGLTRQADWYSGRGDIEKAGSLMERAAAMQERADNNAWRTEQQTQQRGVWDRAAQGRDAMAQAEMYSPAAYDATMQRLNELGPDGAQARGLYQQHFATQYGDAQANAARKLVSLGDFAGANALYARREKAKAEGVLDTIAAVRQNKTGKEIRRVFDSAGEGRFDSDPMVESIKDAKGNVVDHRLAGTMNGQPFHIPSLNEWEKSTLTPKERLTLEQSDKERESMALYRDRMSRAALANAGNRGLGRETMTQKAEEMAKAFRGADPNLTEAQALQRAYQWLTRAPTGGIKDESKYRDALVALGPPPAVEPGDNSARRQWDVQKAYLDSVYEVEAAPSASDAAFQRSGGAGVDPFAKPPPAGLGGGRPSGGSLPSRLRAGDPTLTLDELDRLERSWRGLTAQDYDTIKGLKSMPRASTGVPPVNPNFRPVSSYNR